MLEHFMEPHNFQQGIRNFLKKFAFENAATPDLWASLQVSWADEKPGYLP